MCVRSKEAGSSNCTRWTTLTLLSSKLFLRERAILYDDGGVGEAEAGSKNGNEVEENEGRRLCRKFDEAFFDGHCGGLLSVGTARELAPLPDPPQPVLNAGATSASSRSASHSQFNSAESSGSGVDGAYGDGDMDATSPQHRQGQGGYGGQSQSQALMTEQELHAMMKQNYLAWIRELGVVRLDLGVLEGPNYDRTNGVGIERVNAKQDAKDLKRDSLYLNGTLVEGSAVAGGYEGIVDKVATVALGPTLARLQRKEKKAQS